jgi:hypothetical protein
MVENEVRTPPKNRAKLSKGERRRPEPTTVRSLLQWLETSEGWEDMTDEEVADMEDAIRDAWSSFKHEEVDLG